MPPSAWSLTEPKVSVRGDIGFGVLLDYGIGCFCFASSQTHMEFEMEGIPTNATSIFFTYMLTLLVSDPR